VKLVKLRLSNFRCFGPEATEISLADTTFILGPNGSGKTAVLQALGRMFSLDPAQRKIRTTDFHIAANEDPEDAPSTRDLWIEADFEFPELADADEAEEGTMPSVAGHFSHLQMETDDASVRIRFRLQASLDEDGDIEESFTHVTQVDDDGTPTVQGRVSKQDRAAVQVHYLPARRNPADHISYAANALLGRALRAANWSAERQAISALTEQISAALVGNASVEGISDELTKLWGSLHKGKFYANPTLSFAQNEIENLLRHLSLSFAPGHDTPQVDFSRLSDGQQSLLYITLVLAMRAVGNAVLAGDTDAFDIDKLRPPLFTLVAVEEPENSLSPHYLGRVLRTLSEFAEDDDAQVLIATHAPSLLRRVGPETIRYLRLDEQRRTTVSRITMPDGADANKYVREAIQAFPELYFARLLILGEGDSEEVVLPRLLAARGILADDASISVVPLGGRHVNHFWRLLSDLGIPFVTLLDLDLARHQGGWGRIRYAAKQLLRFRKDPVDFDEDHADAIPEWDSEQGLMVEDDGWIATLEKNAVFFSSPLDLDFMMLEAFPDAYGLTNDELEDPDDGTIDAVLGKSHDVLGRQYDDAQQQLFMAYQKRFKLGSKPSWHIRAMAKLDDAALLEDMPQVLDRMFDLIEEKLAELPE
jgi:putative ATP-dependent endonuclease of the OLD family